MRHELFKLCIWLTIMTGFASSALADRAGLLQTNVNFLSPLQTLQITVYDVNDLCTITITNPLGVVHTFSGQVAGNQATGSYIPSYLPGLYHIFAQTTGPVPLTETDTVEVLSASDSLSISNWQCNSSSYVPGQDLTFTFNLADSASAPLTGFSGQLSDSRTDVTGGALSILRRIVNVGEDGTATARLLLYFDTTGQWSNIYAGTQVKIGLYNADGSTPLHGRIIRTTGFENNDGGYLTSTLTESLWTVTVAKGISGSDKIAYLDFEVPPTLSISDILVSVDYIKYSYNASWGDRIYIRENYITPSTSGFDYTTGYEFSTLGRFPIYLPMTPDENGLLYYGVYSTQPLGSNTLNNGTLSGASGVYTNVWGWEDYLEATAKFYIYADKWGYGHDFSGPITLGMDGGQGQSNLAISGFSANKTSYFPGEAIDFSFALTDQASNAVTGFTGTIADPLPAKTGGAMYILRQFLNAEPTGASTARLYVYFDTTGGWSDINAGTKVQISVYNRDGITPLTGDIGLTTGFINNDDSKLSCSLAGNLWTVQVDSSFVSNDKIAYLDFALPPSYSVSDVVFSVDSIRYFRNAGWGDEIYITTARATESNFPIDLNGQIVFSEGDSFPGLGQFPVKLTLNPNPNGFVYYDFNCADIPETNINFGSLTSSGNQYHNVFTWNDVITTSAQVFAYADGWGYAGHAVGTPITLGLDAAPRELNLTEYALDSRGYTMNDTRKLSVRVDDGYGNPENYLTFKDSIVDSNNGKLSIVSQYPYTKSDGRHVVRLLMYFDTTGSWSNIYAGTHAELSIYGPDGKTGVPPSIEVVEGGSGAEGYLSSTLTNNGGIYGWTVDVTTGFAGADRQVWLDFVMPEPYSASQVVYAVHYIKYYCNTDYADYITIKNVTLGLSSFPVDYAGQYEFKTGSSFGSLGKFPLYLSLNPGQASVFPKMISGEDTALSGSMGVSAGRYTYSHYFTDTGNDYETQLCISRYGYMENECLCSDSIMLYFTGEPRYLGGLESGPVMLGETWQKNLHEHFFIEQNYSNVLYTSSDPNIVIAGNIATFSPETTADTVANVVITAQSFSDPGLIAWSEPFTLIAADCKTSYDCDDPAGRAVACMNYQCQAYDGQSSYRSSAQGVDLAVFNQSITLSNPFPEPNEVITICAEIQNTGTTNIYDVLTEFYLDDVNSAAIDSNTITVLATTYLDLPFRSAPACIAWKVPSGLRGAHRIWVKVSGRYPLEMEEDMLSNNYATADFFIPNPDMTETDPAAIGGCPPPEPMQAATSAAMSMPMAVFNAAPQCQTMMMLIPIRVQVCENEIVCGPVMGYELSYWSTLYWPSWSGYCREYGVPQEAITDFIRTYERIYGLGSQGAGSELPSWTDIPGLFETPEGWGDGWLPCHPEPTMFPYIMYEPGVINPDCGGLCPVSAWDCGEGVHFYPRFSSPLYHAYAFNVTGGARRITRCHTEMDIIRVPYQICYTPGDDTPILIPFNPFDSGPGGPGGCCYGPNGPGGPSSGPGGGPPINFTIAGPPTDEFGNGLPFGVSFCSTGTGKSNEQNDILLLPPNGGGPEAGILLQRGWHQFSPLLEPLATTADRRIALKAGWNLFGYSSMTPLLWVDAVIENGAEQKTIEEAHEAGWIQGVIYTLDYQTLLYQLVPGDEDFLRNKRAYWLHAAQAGLTLKLPGAGGSPQGASAAWETMLGVNGQETKTVGEAALAGWIDPAAYAIDPAGSGYRTIPADVNTVEAWNGYWLWSHLNGLRLMTPEQQAAQQQALAAQSAEPAACAAEETETVLASAQAVIEEGQAAPEFTLKTAEGRSVSLRDYLGKDVLLVFGNTRCPFCSQKLPLLNRLQQAGDFEVIYIAMGTTPKPARQFVLDKKIQFTVLVDSNQFVGRAYGIRSIPEAFIIDREGIVQLQSTSEGQALWYLLEGKPIPPSLNSARRSY